MRNSKGVIKPKARNTKESRSAENRGKNLPASRLRRTRMSFFLAGVIFTKTWDRGIRPKLGKRNYRVALDNLTFQLVNWATTPVLFLNILRFQHLPPLSSRKKPLVPAKNHWIIIALLNVRTSLRILFKDQSQSDPTVLISSPSRAFSFSP